MEYSVVVYATITKCLCVVCPSMCVVCSMFECVYGWCSMIIWYSRQFLFLHQNHNQCNVIWLRLTKGNWCPVYSYYIQLFTIYYCVMHMLFSYISNNDVSLNLMNFQYTWVGLKIQTRLFFVTWWRLLEAKHHKALLPFSQLWLPWN